MSTKRDQLITVLRTLEPYWPLAHALSVFVCSKYADDLVRHKLGAFIQEAIIGIRLSSASEQKSNMISLHQQAEVKKQQDLDKAEKLLSGSSVWGPETLEQNQIDNDGNKIIEANELRSLVPELTNKERKKLAKDLSLAPEIKITMLASCEKMYDDLSAKVIKGETLTKQDIELFQLSIYILGKNTNIVIDGVITPGKLTEQLIKEINPEYFRVISLIERFGPECIIDINTLWLSRPTEERTIIFEKVRKYHEILVGLRVEQDDMNSTLYHIFVHGINSHGDFNDTKWFDDLNTRIRKAQRQLRQWEEEKAKQKAREKREQRIFAIGESVPALRNKLSELSKELDGKQKEYERIYKEFVDVLKQNNTFLEKANAVSPYLSVLTTGPFGLLMNALRSKSSPSTNEMQQLVLYDRLTKKYDEIVQLQSNIKKTRSSVEGISKEQQCLYYEVLRDYDKRAAAEQALINLIASYGDPIRKQYAADIQLYAKDTNEMNQALFTANKAKLNAIVQQKNRAIDLAQQLMADDKIQWGKMDVSGLQHLSQDDIYTIIGHKGLQQSIMIGDATSVRDGTANVRVVQTQEMVIEKGNRMGVKTGYETIGGTTSTQSNALYAAYQIATDQFKILMLPGMGSINVRIDPSLYDQIISFSQKGKQLTFDPVYNEQLQCFEIKPSNIFITRIDKQGTIAYQTRPGAGGSINYITKKEYQSLLQVKKGLTNLVAEQGPVMEILSYQEQLEQVATPIQRLAKLYSQLPGDQQLSDAIVNDLTSPGGLKEQLVALKKLLAKNRSYQNIITELKQNRSGVYDRYEEQLYNVEQILQSLPSFAEQIDGLLNYSIWENADARALKEFAITVVAVVGGVLLAVATGGMASGVSAMVISAAAGSLGGMTSSRLAQEAFARGTDTGGLTNDLHSDIGKCMLGQAKWEDVLPQVGMEFAQGTATTLMFMGAGRIIGQQLEKFVTANAGVVSREVKVAHRTWKAISKLNDKEIQLLDSKGFNKFVAKLSLELKEEFAQEGAQKGAEKLDPRLGTLINIITSIGGKTQYRAGKMDVFIEGSNSATNTTTVSYKGNVGEFQTAISEQIAASGYILDQERSLDGKLIYTREATNKKQILEFVPTQEATTIKEIDLPKNGYTYGVAFDPERSAAAQNTYHYTYDDMTVGGNNLITYLTRNNMIIVDGVAEDGSFTVLAKNGEKIIFSKKSTINSEEPLGDNTDRNDQGSGLTVEPESVTQDALPVDEATSDAPQVSHNHEPSPTEGDHSETMAIANDNDTFLETAIEGDVLQTQAELQQSVMELEQELEEATPDENAIQNKLGSIVKLLNRQLKSIVTVLDGVKDNPVAALGNIILKLQSTLSKKFPEYWIKVLSTDYMREMFTLFSDFVAMHGSVAGPLAGLITVVTAFNIKLQDIIQLKLQKHMQQKLENIESIDLPRNRYGQLMYAHVDGTPLSSGEAVKSYKKNLIFVNDLLGNISGAVYLIKTSFHINSTFLLPSDVDVALNSDTGKKLVHFFLSGATIPGIDHLIFEDTSTNPPQDIPLANDAQLFAACDAGTLRIAYETHIDGVAMEHELFVERPRPDLAGNNKNQALAVFDTDGNILDAIQVDVDGIMVPHLGENTTVQYLSALVERGFDQLMDGTDTKGKFFKRLRDLGDTKQTLGYLNAVTTFINNVRSRVETKIGFKRGDEYLKQVTALRKSSKLQLLFDYIPQDHPALTSSVQVNRDLDRDIYNLNEQCMLVLRGGEPTALSSILSSVEVLLANKMASLDQLVHLAALKLLIVRNGANSLGPDTGLEHMYYRYNLPDASLEEAHEQIPNKNSPFYVPQRYYNQGGQVHSREAIKTLAGPPLLGACEMAYDKNIVTYGSDYVGGSGSGYIEIRLDKLSPENRTIIESMQANSSYLIDFVDSSQHAFGSKNGDGTPFVRIGFPLAATTLQLQKQSLEFMSKLERQGYMADVFDLNDPNDNEQFAEIVSSWCLSDSPEEINQYFKDAALSGAIVVTHDNKVYIYPREYERVAGKNLFEYNPNPDWHYFPGRKSRLLFSENDARGNAKMIDDVAGDQTNDVLRKKAKEQILDTFEEKQVDLPEGFVVDDSFLDTIVDVHLIVGEDGEGLGKFSLGALLTKRRALDAYLKTKKDLTAEQQSVIARCLMEGGFCGRDNSNNEGVEFSDIVLADRQGVVDKQSLEDFIDKACESYKSGSAYQSLAQLGVGGLVDKILSLRKNKLINHYGDSQESIDHFKNIQEADAKAILFDLGFVRFEERIVDLGSRLQLSREDITSIIKNYFSHEVLDASVDDHYNLSMLGHLLLKVQNIALAKKDGLINDKNEHIVQSLSNSNMFNFYFDDIFDLRNLLSQNRTEQLQAQLEEKLTYKKEMLDICEDLGFSVSEDLFVNLKLSLPYLRQLQKIKPIVYGNSFYLNLIPDGQRVIKSLSDFDAALAVKLNMNFPRIMQYVIAIKNKEILFKPEDIPGLERLYEKYRSLKGILRAPSLDLWMCSTDFDPYILLYKAFGNSFDSQWRNHYNQYAKSLSVQQYLTLFASFDDSADSPGYVHFMANYEKCGGPRKYLLLHEKLSVANTDGWNRRREFQELETNVLSKTPEDFLLLYEYFGNDKGKYEQYYSLVDRIAQSPSGELQLIGGEVAKQLVGRKDPMVILNQIIEIFEKNNLPEIGKQFKVFQILHPPQYLEQKIEGGEVFDPQLLELYNRTDINAAQKYKLAMDLFYTDLLRIHIESSNHQLKSYVEFMMEGESLLSRYEGGQELSPQERKRLVSRLQKLNTLYINSSAIRSRSSGVDNQSISEKNINDIITQLRRQIGVGPGETIGGKLADIFVRPAGYTSFAELSTHMDSQHEQYHKRGEELYHNAKLDTQGNRVLVLQEGDLINGFGGEGVPSYMERVLQIGPAAKEFLGYGGSKSGDRTKLDADFIRVTPASQNNFNLFTKYGDVHGVFEPDPSRIFKTQVQGDDHVGIRTGVDSGSLKFIRVQESVVSNPTQLSQLFACIAIHGWYVPICDSTGKIIFSPSDYQVYRNAFAGTKHGDQHLMISDKIIPQPLQDATSKLQQDMSIDQALIMQKNEQLSLGITTVLAKYNIQTKQDDYDGDLSKALVLNTGSTGRGTNVPGDFDFDLAIGLTDSQIRDYGEQVQNDLAVFLGGQAAAGNKPGQIRITNSPEFGDVDVLITRRNQFTEYYTHNAIEERLDLIKREYGEAKYNVVRANIVLAKKLCKEAGVYKKTEGGMTGAGIENRILSHGGDIYTAALSFLEFAKIYPDLQEFALHYLVVDPGVDLRSASRDNFLLLGNANQESFEKMKAICERIVSGGIG